MITTLANRGDLVYFSFSGGDAVIKQWLNKAVRGGVSGVPHSFKNLDLLLFGPSALLGPKKHKMHQTSASETKVWSILALETDNSCRLGTGDELGVNTELTKRLKS